MKTLTKKSGFALLAASVLVLTGCNAVGTNGAGNDDGNTAGDGFAYGAPQSEVDALIADLDPVTLTYQPAAQSPTALVAESAEKFKSAIEKRSDGKITLDIVYGQAIAGFADIGDALVDGRVDLAFSAPIYVPADYPVYNAMTPLAAGMPNSPVYGETVTSAALLELGWNSPELLAEFDGHGLTPLIPLFNTGNYFTFCTEPRASLDDWAGTQVRTGNPAQIAVVTAMGATPVSMTFPEMFEGLQRGTVDCALSTVGPAFELGIVGIAPYVGHTSSENSFSGNTGGALVAGSKFQNLPLAYQQILFDEAMVEAAGNTVAAGLAVEGTIKSATEAGGSFEELDSETDTIIGQVGKDEIKGAAESGLVASDIAEQRTAALARWADAAETFGLNADEGFDDFDPEAFDAEKFFAQVYEDVVAEHRPQ